MRKFTHFNRNSLKIMTVSSRSYCSSIYITMTTQSYHIFFCKTVKVLKIGTINTYSLNDNTDKRHVSYAHKTKIQKYFFVMSELLHKKRFEY